MAIKKEGDGKQLEALRKVILAKLDSVEKKKFEESSIDEFSLAFRVFLLKYLNIGYEFTEEELSQELERKKAGKAISGRITGLANLLDEIKYHGRKISKSEFNKMVSECSGIIKLATRAAEDISEKQPESAEKKASSNLSESWELKNKIRNSIKKIYSKLNFSALVHYFRQKKTKAEGRIEQIALQKQKERQESLRKLEEGLEAKKTEEKKRKTEGQKYIEGMQKQKDAEKKAGEAKINRLVNKGKRHVKEFFHKIRLYKTHKEKKEFGQILNKFKKISLKIIHSAKSAAGYLKKIKLITKKKAIQKEELEAAKEALRIQLFEERKHELERIKKVQELKKRRVAERQKRKEKLNCLLDKSFKFLGKIPKIKIIRFFQQTPDKLKIKAKRREAPEESEEKAHKIKKSLKAAQKNIAEFLHKIGLHKTQEEKNRIKLQKEKKIAGQRKLILEQQRKKANEILRKRRLIRAKHLERIRLWKSRSDKLKHFLHNAGFFMTEDEKKQIAIKNKKKKLERLRKQKQLISQIKLKAKQKIGIMSKKLSQFWKNVLKKKEPASQSELKDGKEALRKRLFEERKLELENIRKKEYEALQKSKLKQAVHLERLNLWQGRFKKIKNILRKAGLFRTEDEKLARKLQREKLLNERKKSIKEFFHKIGFYRTAEEKNIIALQKEERNKKENHENLKIGQVLENQEEEKRDEGSQESRKIRQEEESQ